MKFICKNCGEDSVVVKFAHRTDYMKCELCGEKFKEKEYYNLESKTISNELMEIEFRNFKETNQDKVIIYLTGAKKRIGENMNNKSIRFMRIDKYLHYHDYRLISISPGKNLAFHNDVLGYVQTINHIISSFNLEPKNIIIMGFSNGGTMLNDLLPYIQINEYKKICFSSPAIGMNNNLNYYSSHNLVYFNNTQDDYYFNCHVEKLKFNKNIKIVDLKSSHSSYQTIKWLFNNL